MELSSLFSFATNASIPALIFIIWFLSYKQNNEQFLKQQEHNKSTIEQNCADNKRQSAVYRKPHRSAYKTRN